MLSKKKLWLKLSLFFITLIIVPILIFESIMISKNTKSIHRNINLKRLITDKLNTVLGKKSLEFSLTKLLSVTDGQIKKGDVFLNYKVVEYDSNRIILGKGKNRIEIPWIEIPLNRLIKKHLTMVTTMTKKIPLRKYLISLKF
ncbi:MAG: hypothetical protein H8D45_25190 [Bacteroidetes bacterium]|nr:hypothetical protein [Bacteroidota bacterium]MBL7067218.1 hypothetical protein [Candidatus Neomarinimicrobiota bacterium]